nr:MAG TPA: hypothetical protein [Bacteriophage sp.]
MFKISLFLNIFFQYVYALNIYFFIYILTKLNFWCIIHYIN